MSLISGEADPSENRAAERNATAAVISQGRVTFNRFELGRILDLYGRMVADGEWRDYRIEKDPRLARKQGAYSVISATGLILRRGHELDRVLLVIDRKPALV
jgi:hypothetical protein